MLRTILSLAVAAGGLWFAQTAAADAFSLSSPDIAEGKPLAEAQVYSGFGCHGGNKPPLLVWSDPPAGSKSFAVTVYDPDAPTGSGWWHWLVYDIPASASRVGGGSLPAGARQGRSDFGSPGFGGACPPPGKPHRYVFTVHALKTEHLEVGAEASGAMIGFLINANSLGHASITATYGR